MASERKNAELWKFLRKKSNDEILTEGLASMFVRKGLPDDFRECDGFIEEILLKNGCGAYVFRDDTVEKRWIFGSCDLVGEPAAYGFGKNAIVRAGGGYVKQFDDWKENPDIVVAFNNPLRLSDQMIPYTADRIGEVDASLNSVLMNARVHPLPVVRDEKMKAVVEEALKDSDAGKLRTIVSSNLMKDLAELGVTMDPAIALNLTDPNLSSLLQYLGKYREDLLRWFWNLYGQNAQENAKLAQQSVAEVTTGESISMILPHTRYHERQKEVAELKRKFGWDVTIEFSEPWQNSFARCRKEDGEELPGEGVEDVEDNDEAAVPDDADETGSTADEV